MSDITPEDREALVGQAAYHLRKREEAEEQLAISQKYRSEAERQSTAWARDLEEWKQSFQRVLGERDAERAAHEATKAELAKEQRLTRFAQTQSRDELLARAEAAETWVAGLERKPLRTRAEVDAEIVRSVRECIEKSLLFPRPELKALCAEPTADPQPHGSSSDRVDSPPRVDAAAGATFSHQNPVQNPRCLTCNAGMVYRHTLTDSGWYCFPCAVKRPAPPMPSGPRPAPATKESSDTAGVEAGAANRITDHDADQREEDPLHPTGRCTCGGEGRCEWCMVPCEGCRYPRAVCICEPDPEACSCEESEALKDELKECRQLLDYARRCAQDIVTVLEEARK